jgi:hypothetical protein
MRSAPAYPKRALLRALGFEKGGLHTRLGAMFALIFGFWAHFLRQWSKQVCRKKPGFPL